MTINKATSLLLLLFFIFHFNAQALSPKKEYKETPHDLRMTFEEYSIATADGATLKAWYFPSTLGDQLMIISHDGVGNMGSYLKRVKALIKYGFSVLIYDYRGYGESSDFAINNLDYVYKEFYNDFDAVYEFSEAKFHHELIAYGWGIGAGISLSRGFTKDNIAGIVADEPFFDFSQMKNQFKNIQGLMQIPTGLEDSNYDTKVALTQEPGKKLRGLLFLHGNKNFLFNRKDIEQLISITNHDYKEIHAFDRSNRMDNFGPNASEYCRAIYAFALNL